MHSSRHDAGGNPYAGPASDHSDHLHIVNPAAAALPPYNANSSPAFPTHTLHQGSLTDLQSFHYPPICLNTHSDSAYHWPALDNTLPLHVPYDNVAMNSGQAIGAVDQRLLEQTIRMQAMGVDHLNQTAEEDAFASNKSKLLEEACTPRPRWNPTQEQVQMLEWLFNSGTTTPSRDMIVDIAEQLRQYGAIGEANVFYWFQNRKARAKRKQLQSPSPSV